MKQKTLKDVSFDDPNGATIAVPAHQIAFYSAVKSGQLAVLSSIIADHTSGFKVELDDNRLSVLSSLSNELAHACNEFMCVLSEAAPVPPAAMSAENEGAQ